MYYSHLEDYIHHLYQSMQITYPYQLNISSIANRLGIEVGYGGNVSFRFDNQIILKEGSKEEQWQLFGHEVCHYLRHSGNQLAMHPLFIDLQEYQANYFAYHFCIPTFMLAEQKKWDVSTIIKTFTVTEAFAHRRMEIYEHNHLM